MSRLQFPCGYSVSKKGGRMKPAAFVSTGPSLEATLGELRELDAKVFGGEEAVRRLEQEGIRAQELGDPIGLSRIFSFGHKEIHLFGFDCSIPDENATRVCFENRVFFTTPDLAMHAQMLVRACLELTEKGASIAIHGDGMFPHMARTVMRDSQVRVLTAIYDMQVAPPTYEIFTFLSAAEKYRLDKGFDCIDLIFLPGPMFGFRDDGLPPSVPERQSMLHRVCVSGARLLPSVRNVHVMTARSHISSQDVFPPDWTNDRPRFAYGPKYQKNGLRCLVSTQAARDEINRLFQKKYATITLREAEYWPSRNSNLKAWDAAARELQWSGVEPVIIPDTHGAGIPKFKNFWPAAWDVDLRMALYESAEMNFFVSNGPMSLCILGAEKCPYTTFILRDGSPATNEEFLAANGVNIGDQWSENGRAYYEDDTVESVVRVIRQWTADRIAA
jgi:hypothetical protein